MIRLAEGLIKLGFEPRVDFEVRDDSNGEGPYLYEWYSEKEIPSDEEIEAALEDSIVPDRVTARQFKLQLLAFDMLDDVEEWVANQSREIQIAYENSGTFDRHEPMMQIGFTELGFTKEQGDAFFISAANL